ncbi:type II toxin-antitoxin system Phd/YefM family antitoxin [uncultured Shewanella sp.]|uniref:type II toxin-antitoxin system Phd/YefM family antitoxin n=1 Tax=uncultured Shewanella sp. TaxID=173975 RepID=UPI002622D7BB|nr:type II toxin-antitoxin system Phd/YefM family antitoxin [uncultured Shewanella sp.]
MNSVSVNKFRDNLKAYVEQTVNEHEPLKVTRRTGEDFIVVSADDWARDQETLHVLQNISLMQQISESMKTHTNEKGYTPTEEQMNEITDF